MQTSREKQSESPLAFVGRKPVKLVTIKIFAPDNRTHTTHRVAAGAGKAFTQDGLDELLEGFVTKIERLQPDDEYALKNVGRGAYNFVWLRKRSMEEMFGEVAR